MVVNQIICGDCIEVMNGISDKSIDMILCDLPYGTTACKWDTIIPFEPLWEQYKRIIKDNGAIVLTASQPFTTALVMSNTKMFKYEWIWNKESAGNFVMAKKQPLKKHENILVFYKNQPTYNPIMQNIEKDKIRPNRHPAFCRIQNLRTIRDKNYNNKIKYPSTVLSFPIRNAECNNVNRIHPTQKPVALFEYLIKTYTNKGDLVLDNCAGSGTTGVACKNLNRRYILIEKDEKYCQIARDRINQTPGSLFKEIK